MASIKLPITYSYVILITKADTCLNSQGVNHYRYNTLGKLAVLGACALDSQQTWIKSISLRILHYCFFIPGLKARAFITD